MKSKLLSIVVSIAIVALLVVFFSNQNVHASAPSGLQATLATTTNPTVSTTAAVLLATSTCSARIISTGASAIMLTFSDYANQTPTGQFGLQQAASTTVAYDSGQYGCGLVKAYSFTSQVITVSETR